VEESLIERSFDEFTCQTCVNRPAVPVSCKSRVVSPAH
jgi:hypothetical protein